MHLNVLICRQERLQGAEEQQRVKHQQGAHILLCKLRIYLHQTRGDCGESEFYFVYTEPEKCVLRGVVL